MIYNKNFLSKEFNEAFIEDKTGLRSMIKIGAFMGVLAFAIHFYLLTFSETVLLDLIPQIMVPSYFSICHIYVYLSSFIFLLHIIKKYRLITFSELYDNKWYALLKMGFNTKRMTVLKIVARSIYFITTYSIGFVTSLLLGITLKYTFVIDYVITIYFIGLADILCIMLSTMAVSLFTENSKRIRSSSIFFAGCLFILKIFTGFFDFFNDRVLTQFTLNLFLQPYFLIVVISSIALSIYLGVSGTKARRYFSPKKKLTRDIISVDFMTNKVTALSQIKEKGDALNKVVVFLLILVILVGLGLNGFLLYVSFSSPTSGDAETMPFLFSSSTMEPLISKNDFIILNKSTPSTVIKLGDIVMFEEKGELLVQVVIDTQDDGKLLLDITNYPTGLEAGTLQRTINKSEVLAVFESRNRYIGAIAFFANGIVGRAILLIVPLFYLFFGETINKTIRKYRKMRETDY